MTDTIAHVVQHLQPGGIETLVLELQANSSNTHIISLDGDEGTARSNWSRLMGREGRLHFLGKPAGISPRTVFRLAATLRTIGANVVHTHHIGPLLYGGIAARMTSRCRLVHTEHDAWHLNNPKRAKLAGRLFRMLKPTVISDADAVAGQLETLLAIPSTVVRNGIDTNRFKPQTKREARARLGLPLDGPIIGCAGRLEPVKNQSLLLKAVASLPALRNVTIAIAGDGSQREALHAKARELGLDGWVYFMGHVEDMPRFMNALDVFVLPSQKEGYPLSLIEAQACDVPVVATDVGGAKEAVCSESGVVVPPDCSRSLAQGIADRLGANDYAIPRRFALSEGSITAMIQRHSQIYARVAQ